MNTLFPVDTEDLFSIVAFKILPFLPVFEKFNLITLLAIGQTTKRHTLPCFRVF